MIASTPLPDNDVVWNPADENAERIVHGNNSPS